MKRFGVMLCGPQHLLIFRALGGRVGRAYFSTGSSPSFTKRSARDDTPGRVVVITSGKGGVGKTTTAASFAFGLAERGLRTAVIDFDIGLRNLDIHLGCERRVIFDFVNVLNEECSLKQALIRDKRNDNLSLLAASQTRDKTALTEDGVGRILEDLKADFDYVVCDSPAGIESGARHAMYFADDAIVCTNPELSSCRDSDKMIGFIASRSLRAEEGREPVNQRLLLTRYDLERVAREDCLTVEDLADMLGLPLLGVIPESRQVLSASNMGQPVILSSGTDVAVAYNDMVDRFLGADIEMKFVKPEPKGLLGRLLHAARSATQ